MEFVKVMEERQRILDKYCNIGLNCTNCPFKGPGCDDDLVDFCLDDSLMEEDPEEFEKIVMNWSKNNPKMTNIEKVVELIKENFDVHKDGIFVGKTCITMTQEFADKEYMAPKK